MGRKLIVFLFFCLTSSTVANALTCAQSEREYYKNVEPYIQKSYDAFVDKKYIRSMKMCAIASDRLYQLMDVTPENCTKIRKEFDAALEYVLGFEDDCE